MATTPPLRAAADNVVVIQQTSGIALIPKPTPLTRLNYFDGKFLRAADLQAEQDYHRRLQQLAAQAGGSGVVNGFELRRLAGDQLELAAGLAIDPDGRVLHMPLEAAVSVAELIARSAGSTAIKAGAAPGAAVFTLCDTAAVTPQTPAVAGTSLYVVGISHAEALCGQEDVLGRICEEACAGGTERPQRLEGVVLRALPLLLATPLPATQAEALGTLHLRSQVASAYFGDEGKQVESLISGAGLLSGLWCSGAAATGGQFLPLAVLARAGGHTVFLDGWTARRERVDGRPRRYWQWRMMMRPWDVFLAQVLQFQCQLRDAWSTAPTGDDDPCADLRRSVVEVSDILTRLERQYRETTVRLASTDGRAAINTNAAAANAVPLSRTLLDSAVKRAALAKGDLVLQPSERVLIRRGIVELPSAGYLPVAPGSAFPVNEQVRRLMGEGVDLRFCVVRPDFVAHALEEAQHMARISLLRGLDNPQQKEAVDILVPDGQIVSATTTAGVGWEVRVAQSADPAAGKLRLTGSVTGNLATEGTGSTGAVPGLAADSAARALDRQAATLSVNQPTAVVTTQAYQRSVMSGAGRTEARGDGALSFFFAGLVETDSRDAALVELKRWAAERDNGLEQTLWKSVELINARDSASAVKGTPAKRSRTEAAAAADILTPQALASRFAALREQSVAYRLKALERAANTATLSGVRHFEGLKDGSDNDHTAMWLALRAEADPLNVAEGGRVDMSLDLGVISPKRGGTQFVDIGVVGAQFIVESRVTSGQRTTVQGTLRGAAIVGGLVGTLANDQRGLQFNVPALVSAQPTADGLRISVEVDFSSLLFDGRGLLGVERLGVRVQTGSDGRQAEVLVTLTAKGTGLKLAARLQRNDAVLTLGHPLRSIAETAIDVLATRDTAPGFATQARADLFGARAPQGDAITINAKRDWVLFHRRRDKQCGVAPAAPALEQRRYEIHHLRVKTEAQVRAARAAVLGANAANIRKLGFAPVGGVAFDGGRSTIATATAALLADWQSAQPGNLLRFGAIGSQGAAQGDGDALAQARLAALELTLAQGRPQAGLENQVLPVLPEVGLAGWDGAVFLLTLESKTACHQVYAIDGQKSMQAFAAEFKRAGLKAAVQKFGLQPFARGDFGGDGKTLQPDSVLALRDGWGDRAAPLPPALVFHAGSSAAGDAQAVAQADAIATALGGSPDGTTALATDGLADVTDCDGVTVLIESQPLTLVVLVGFAQHDGRFFFNTDTPLSQHVFVDGRATDGAKYAAALRVAMGQKPDTVTAASPTAASQPLALPLKAYTDEVLAELGATGVSLSNQQLLSADEIKDIEALGFAQSTWQHAVLLSRRR